MCLFGLHQMSFFLRSRIGTDSRNRKKEYRAQLSSRLYYNSARPDRARNSVTPVDLCHSRYAPAENAAWQYALRLVLSVQPFLFAFLLFLLLLSFWLLMDSKQERNPYIMILCGESERIFPLKTKKKNCDPHFVRHICQKI